MGNQKMNEQQGHWILAKMGKKVLRPGGKELTKKMISHLNITPQDDVVEFAPGLGFTANITLQANPKTYTGVELNEEAANMLRKTINSENSSIIIGNAAQSTLPDEHANKVYGEAMLTMQADHRKSEIIREAYRILQPGGLYAIHELGLKPNGIPEDIKAEIQLELAKVIKVNARPLTVSEWSELLEKEGFTIVATETNAMHLLEPKRMIEDEGILGAAKIAFNVLTHSEERKRILAMREVFRKYESHLNAVCLVAAKL